MIEEGPAPRILSGPHLSPGGPPVTGATRPRIPPFVLRPARALCRASWRPFALGKGSNAGVGRLAEDAVLIGAAASWCTWTSLRLQSKYPEAPYRARTLRHAWRVSAAPNCSRRPEGGGK